MVLGVTRLCEEVCVKATRKTAIASKETKSKTIIAIVKVLQRKIQLPSRNGFIYHNQSKNKGQVRYRRETNYETGNKSANSQRNSWRHYHTICRWFFQLMITSGKFPITKWIFLQLGSLTMTKKPAWRVTRWAKQARTHTNKIEGNGLARFYFILSFHFAFKVAYDTNDVHKASVSRLFHFIWSALQLLQQEPAVRWRRSSIRFKSRIQ